jgi:hypothetical protein
LASRGAEFVDCLLPALRIASHDQNMNAQLCEFIRSCATNSARSSSDKGCRSVCHGQFPRRELRALDSQASKTVSTNPYCRIAVISSFGVLASEGRKVRIMELEPVVTLDYEISNRGRKLQAEAIEFSTFLKWYIARRMSKR